VRCRCLPCLSSFRQSSSRRCASISHRSHELVSKGVLCARTGHKSTDIQGTRLCIVGSHIWHNSFGAPSRRQACLVWERLSPRRIHIPSASSNVSSTEAQCLCSSAASCSHLLPLLPRTLHTPPEPTIPQGLPCGSSRRLQKMMDSTTVCFCWCTQHTYFFMELGERWMSRQGM